MYFKKPAKKQHKKEKVSWALLILCYLEVHTRRIPCIPCPLAPISLLMHAVRAQTSVHRA